MGEGDVHIPMPTPACVERGGPEACQRECDAKAGSSCTVAGLFYSDNADRRIWFEKACSLGDYNSCMNLAGHHLADDVIPVDAPRARSLYERACTAGVPEGCVALAQLLREGRGGPKDEARAKALLQHACRQGCPGTCE